MEQPSFQSMQAHCRPDRTRSVRSEKILAWCGAHPTDVDGARVDMDHYISLCSRTPGTDRSTNCQVCDEALQSRWGVALTPTALLFLSKNHIDAV